MLVLLNMTTTIASLCDNGECSNKSDRELEDHVVYVMLCLSWFDICCTVCEAAFSNRLPGFFSFADEYACGRRGVSDLFGPQIVKANEREAKSIRCNE